MREFNEEKTAEFFNGVFTEISTEIRKEPNKKLHVRDHIFLEKILPKHKKDNLKILDYGCGQGQLLQYLLSAGFDAYGIEKHEGMGNVARNALKLSHFDGNRVEIGSIKELSLLTENSFDIIIVMGVFQYLQQEELCKTFEIIKKLLKSGGSFVASFQNAFFDMYTFNKYTIDYITNEILNEHISNDEKKSVEEALSALITNPSLPEHSSQRARDNIYVRLTNPLSIEKELEVFSLKIKKKYFYEYYGLPPLLRSKLPDIEHKISSHFEFNNSDSWEGHFLANAFLVYASKE